MRKILFIFISFFLITLFLPIQAHAQTVYNFTASNISYDPTTSNLSFDISNVQNGSIPWASLPVQIVVYSNNTGAYFVVSNFGGQPQFNNLSRYCNAIHCSLPVNYIGYLYNLNGNSDVGIYIEGNGSNGAPAWVSQTFKLGCIEPSTNSAPQVSSLSGATITEGGTYSENGSFIANNPNASSWTANVDYGDGVAGLHPFTLSGTNFSLSNIYSNPGTYTVNVCVVDDQGGIGKSSTTVTVNNPLPPSIGTINVSKNPVQINSATTVTASFTDTAGGTTDTALWNWGNGSSSNGTVSESNGSGTVGPDSHTYTTLGTYTVTLTVNNSQDNLNGTSSYVISVVPSGGITGNNLQHANYDEADFSNLDLTKTNGSGGQFQDVNFTSANLTQANFSNSNLTGSSFTDANLTKVNLSNSNLTNSNFTGANLTQANLSGTTITGVIWSNTICPNGTNSNNDGNTCVGQGGGL